MQPAWTASEGKDTMSKYTRRVLSTSVLLLALSLPLTAQPIRGGVEQQAPSWFEAATWLWEQVRLFVAGGDTEVREERYPVGYKVDGQGACNPDGTTCGTSGGGTESDGRGAWDPNG